MYIRNVIIELIEISTQNIASSEYVVPNKLHIIYPQVVHSRKRPNDPDIIQILISSCPLTMHYGTHGLIISEEHRR